MTEKEFLEALAEVPVEWFLLDGMIRCNYGCDCPATALAKHRKLIPDHLTCDDAGQALSALGIDTLRATLRIVAAADGRGTNRAFHQRMLKACGLRAS